MHYPFAFTHHKYLFMNMDVSYIKISMRKDLCQIHAFSILRLFPFSGYSSLISQLIEIPSILKNQIKYQFAHEPLPHYQVLKESLSPLWL